MRRAKEKIWLPEAALVISVFAIFISAFTIASVLGPNGEDREDTSASAEIYDSQEATEAEATWEDETDVEQEDFENEKIEAALIDQGYFRNDVPLSYDEQDFLHTACEEAQLPYALALAVIEKETQFQNIVGYDGTSVGYMQVKERWHRDRMERLGVEDLEDPFGNFRVGCDFLSELLVKYTMEEALTAYNSGSPGLSDYSRKVTEYYEKWKELVGDDVSGIKG